MMLTSKLSWSCWGFVVALIYCREVSSEPPSQSYGAPSSSSSGGSDPSTNYGPPGFTPGQPLSQYGGFGGNGGSRTCRNTDKEENKRIVMEFYQKVFGDKKFDLVDQYIAQDVINHNPMEVDGIDGLREVLMGPLGQGPPMKIDFQRICADGDLVWTHARLPVPALGITYAAADIFRINCDGKIAEHWDVLQDTNVPSKNAHPFF